MSSSPGSSDSSGAGRHRQWQQRRWGLVATSSISRLFRSRSSPSSSSPPQQSTASSSPSSRSPQFESSYRGYTINCIDIPGVPDEINPYSRRQRSRVRSEQIPLDLSNLDGSIWEQNQPFYEQPQPPSSPSPSTSSSQQQQQGDGPDHGPDDSDDRVQLLRERGIYRTTHRPATSASSRPPLVRFGSGRWGIRRRRYTSLSPSLSPPPATPGEPDQSRENHRGIHVRDLASFFRRSQSLRHDCDRDTCPRHHHRRQDHTAHHV